MEMINGIKKGITVVGLVGGILLAGQAWGGGDDYRHYRTNNWESIDRMLDEDAQERKLKKLEQRLEQLESDQQYLRGRESLRRTQKIFEKMGIKTGLEGLD